MAAKTTFKVATLTGAAEDDIFGNEVTQDDLTAWLAVLGNDPGSAKLYRVDADAYVPTTAQVVTDNTAVLTINDVANGVSGSINLSFDTDTTSANFGKVYFDASSLAGQFDYLGDGESYEVSFYYTIQMANGALSQAKVTVQIQGENDAAETNAGSGTGDEDAASIAVSLSGTDVDGTVASFKILSLPTNGILYSDATLTSIISLNDIVTAGGNVATIYFVPDTNFSGAPTFHYAAIDDDGLEDPSAAIATITVYAVADAPTLTSPDTSGDEDSAIPLSISSALTDTDGSESLSITISGIPAGATLSNTNGDTLTIVAGSITFTQAQLTGGVLNGLKITPPANSDVDFSLTVTATSTEANGGDTESTSDTVLVTVNAVNDAPVNSAPGAQSVNEEATLTFNTANGNRISVSDVDDAGDGIVGNETVQVTLSSAQGAISLSGTTGLSFSAGDGTADATMTFTGTLNNINTALNGMSFVPTTNFNGAATLNITTNDQGNFGVGGVLSDTDDVTINVNAVNDAPVNSAPGPQSVNEEATLTFNPANGNLISVSDVDDADDGIVGNELVQVTLSSAQGAISLSGTTGLSFSAGDGTADATMTFTGTLNNINTALNGLSFVPTINFNGAATLNITTNDQGNFGVGGVLSDTDNVIINVNAVNDAPVNSAPGPQSVNEEATLTFNTANGNRISVSDVDDADDGIVGNELVQVTLSSAQGAISLSGTTGLSFSAGDGTADATMTFTGTLNNINTALNGLSFVPTTNFNGPATLNITTSDQGNFGVGGVLSDTDNITINVNAVNDAPVLDATKTPVAAAVLEDAGAPSGAVGTLVSSLVDFASPSGQVDNVTDVDAGALLGIAITGADATNGTWLYSTNNGSSWTALGPVSDASALLLAADANTRLYFQPNANYDGDAALTFRAWDQTSGTAGTKVSTAVNGGATAFSSATDAASFDVTPVADGITNGSFETAFVPSGTDATDGWSVIGDVIQSTDNETDGSFSARLTTGGTPATAANVATFLGVTTANLNSLGNGTATEGAAIKTSNTVHLNAGDHIVFDWFFSGGENPMNLDPDFAFFLSLAGSANLTEIVDAPAVGGNGSTSGQASILIGVSGDYTLGFGILDANNAGQNSTLFIDNVHIV